MKVFAPTVLLALAGQALASVSAFMTVTDYSTSSKSLIMEPATAQQVAGGKAVDIMSWTYGIEQTVSLSSQTSGAGAGKVTFNTLNVVKRVDASTGQFYSYLAQGRPVNLTIYLYKNGAGTSSQPFLTLSFRMAAFRTQTLNSDDETPSETLGLDYGTLQINYSLQKPDGTLVAQQPIGWDRLKNVAATSDVAKINA